ncbi:MAG: peptide ABC transporter substrate-binding protein [Gammaproteobacteria bacterium]
MRRFAALALLCTTLALSTTAASEILRVANPGHPASLDPHRITGVWENRIVGDMLMGLTTEGPGGEVVGGAATAWQVSEDGLRYEFELREHRWSDGPAVTADDFVYSFRRMMSGETTSPYAQFFWVIENGRAVTAGTAPPTALGVEALAPDRLVIRLERRTPYFTGLLMHFAAFPVPRHAIEAHGRDWTSPGRMPANGAFRLAARVPNDHVLLEKNPAFFDADNVRLAGVRYDGLEDRDAALLRFRAGEIDVLRDFPASQAEWLRDRLPEAVRTSPYLGLTFLAVNHAREALQDRRVREALSLAVDRRIITARVLGSGERPAWSLVPPGTADYPAPARATWRDDDMNARRERARELMRAAGYGPQQPLTVRVRYPLSENDRRVAIALQSMWRAIFVTAELERAETAIHYAALQQGDFDLGLASWLAVYDDAQTFTLLLQTENGPNNLGGYSNPAYDRLADEAARQAEPAARARLLREAEALAVREQALIPVYHHVARNLVSPRVLGWQDNMLDVNRSRYLGLAVADDN